MSIPLFPSLRPNLMSPFWGELDPPIDEEAEILQLEREQREWKDDVSQMFANVVPIGKVNQDADDDDLDDMGDDEDDTTSSDDDDDMDDDNGMFRIHDNLSPSPDVAAAAAAVAAAATAAAAASVAVGGFASTSSVISTLSAPVTGDDSSESSSSSESSVTVTLNRVGGESTTPSPGDPSILTSRPATRPARMIVGTHIPAPRPGMPQQPVRLAYISTTHQASRRQQSNSGSVSPTSRAYIDAAMQSTIAQFHRDIPDDEDDTDDDIPDRAAPTQSQRAGRSYSSRPFPGPVSDHLSRYQQMMAAGHIRPSLSSTQIDSLIESMHQRAHAARGAAPLLPSTTITDEAEAATGSNHESDSDSSSVSHEEV